MTDYPLLIGGELVPGDATLDVVNPATGAVFAVASRASAAQLDQAAAAARAAFPGWRATDVAERGRLIGQLADAVEANADELARLLTAEQGKPLAEARMEVDGAAGMLRYFARVRLDPEVREDSDRRHVELVRRPLGVVGAIVPWNFPLLILIGKVGPALATGNTMVAKPAPTTPLTALRFGALAAGILPPGVLNVIADANDLGPAMSAHAGIDKISFTGSTATGTRVMQGAASTLKRLTLELGGNDAALVLDDADPVSIAPYLFGAAFTNNGQICVAVKRIYAHERIYDSLCSELAALADKAVPGDGAEQGVTHGPLQNAAQLARVEELVADARERGRIISGGSRPDLPGFFFRPTIVRDIEDGSRLVDEEQFGPVLPVIRYNDLDDAVERVNRSPYGLGGSVWSSDTARARAVAERIDAGTVWINQHLDSLPHIPFGGAKASGLGVEFGQEGLAEYTQLHVINQAR